jgi:hypothetical protein
VGERRGAGVVNQKTLAEPTGSVPVEPAPPEATPAPTPADPPRPVLYPPAAPSSAALQERQLRWLRTRERHEAARRDGTAGKDE